MPILSFRYQDMLHKCILSFLWTRYWCPIIVLCLSFFACMFLVTPMCESLHLDILSIFITEENNSWKDFSKRFFFNDEESTVQQAVKSGKLLLPAHPPTFLSFSGSFGFLGGFFNSSLAAAVRPTFSPGDDEGRTTAMRRRMKSQARGGEKKINRSSQTKGHLLAWNDNLSCWHKGEDRDKSHSFLRRQRQAPDTGDDSSLCASGLQLQGRFSERKEEIWLTPPGFIK